jgi:hypothetical protein
VSIGIFCTVDLVVASMDISRLSKLPGAVQRGAGYAGQRAAAMQRLSRRQTMQGKTRQRRLLNFDFVYLGTVIADLQAS